MHFAYHMATLVTNTNETPQKIMNKSKINHTN
jgi:hypothetical protein